MAALGRFGGANKRRSIYETDTVRIHLEEVDGWGAFKGDVVELLVPITEKINEAMAKAMIMEMMAKLGIRVVDLVRLSYMN